MSDLQFISWQVDPWLEWYDLARPGALNSPLNCLVHIYFVGSALKQYPEQYYALGVCSLKSGFPLHFCKLLVILMYTKYVLQSPVLRRVSYDIKDINIGQ